MTNAAAASAAALAVLAAGAAAGGPEVDVSRLPGPQSETAVAVEPGSSRILLAGSNSLGEGTMRAYSSADGGATWQSSTVFPAPAALADTCAADPGVAIDGTGRQYYSFVRSTPCQTGAPRLYVATRPDAAAAWTQPVLVAPLAGARFDDKPAITVDSSPASRHRNRAYVAWTRVARNGAFAIRVSSSDDGGKSWSTPRKANREDGDELSYVSLATARRGTLYVAWHDVSAFHVNLVRSTDGGVHFGPEREAAAFATVTIPICHGGIVIPALRLTCAQPDPTIAVDTSGGRFSGRVYVTYALTEFQGDKGIAVSVFDNALRPIAGYPVRRRPLLVAPAPATDAADRFWPASAVDASTGTLWVCFYDTEGDPRRKRARFSCTYSRTGGRSWVRPFAAASVASDETGPGADPREYGDYEAVAAADGIAHPVWTDGRDLAGEGEEIYTSALTSGGARR